MVVLSFELVFYIGPDAEQRWEWITPGSLLGTVVFLGASFGFRIYVQHFSSYNKTYGSLGGVMVLLFWFWISSLVLLTAAQMNQVIEDASPLGKAYGQRVDPTVEPDLNALDPEASSR
jgi:membrane protein